MGRYGRITDPRHIDGPSLDPPDDPPCCEDCEEWCHTEGTDERGSVPCACQDWPEEREGEECPECHGDGRLVCQCSCHSEPPEPDYDAIIEARHDGRQSW